jgi:hypothetical protein
MGEVCDAAPGANDTDGHRHMLSGRALGLTQAKWQKSSYSNYNGACVGVATLTDGLVGVRDTKEDQDADRVLVFSRTDWCAFLAFLKEH